MNHPKDELHTDAHGVTRCWWCVGDPLECDDGFQTIVERVGKTRPVLRVVVAVLAEIDAGHIHSVCQVQRCKAIAADWHIWGCLRPVAI